MSSPTLKRKKNPKNLTLHIQLNAVDLSKDSIQTTPPVMVRSDKTLNKDEAQTSHSKPEIKVFSDRVTNESKLFKLKSDRILLRKSFEREKSTTNFDDEDEKEAEKGRETDRLPNTNPMLKGKTPSLLNENYYYLSNPNIDMNSSIPTTQNAPKEEKAEKKLSFSLGNQIKGDSKKDSKEANMFKFMNLAKRKQDKHSNTKFLKSSRNLLATENDLKAKEDNYKMDKSSLFFRNQLISMNKMQNMDPVEQIFWAIKHNNILKVEPKALILRIFLTF